MTPEQIKQRQQAALQLARSRQTRGLIERMAQRAVIRANNAELARCEQKRQQQKK